jgi:Trp operon repressor
MSSRTEYNHKFTRELIQLRRDKVLELISLGFKQHEIAQQLGVALSTICVDVQFLKETARNNLEDYVEHKIPQQFAECNSIFKLVLRKAWEIHNHPNSKTSERIQSLSIMSETASKLNDLSTDSKILNQAVSWIEKKKEVLESSNTSIAKQEQTTTEEDEEEELTDAN